MSERAIPVVLVVDDEGAVLEICRNFLAPLGCEVLTAGAAGEALEVLRGRGVDAVVTDYQMPGLSGIELLERVRDHHPETVRVLYTGLVDTHIAEAALNRAGAFRFLVKPFSADSLRQAVSDALEYRRLTVENRFFREDMERQVEERGRDLTRTTAFLQGLLEALPAGVLVMGADGVVTRSNPEAEKILGLSGDALRGRPASVVGVPCRASEKGGGAGARAGTACRNRQVSTIEKWGLRRTLLWSCEALAEAGGCVVTFLDLSEEKALEIKVFQAKQEIEAVFDSITDPTFVLRPDMRVIRANRAFALLAKKPFQDLLGKPCRDAFPGRKTGCEACAAAGVFRTGKPADMEFRSRNGGLYKAYYFPLFHQGRVDAVVVRYQDVTAERELEHRLLQSEKMAGLGQLAAGVAHEINNPVGYILSNLNRLGEYAGELAQCGGELKAIAESAVGGSEDPLAAWRRYVDTRARHDLDFLFEDTVAVVAECREGAERIRKIVQDLKTFSHPDAKGWERADLNAGLQSTLNIAWNELKYKCEVVREYGELPPVLCRPQQVNQVFMNLLVNAAQAIEEKGTVTVRTRAEGDVVVVEVSDTGMGIPPEIRNRVFDPFFTTKPAGKGTGLGLNIAANIVRSHGGEIRVASEVGKGTTFTVTLPVTPTAAGQGGGDPVPGQGEATSGPTQGEAR